MKIALTIILIVMICGVAVAEWTREPPMTPRDFRDVNRINLHTYEGMRVIWDTLGIVRDSVGAVMDTASLGLFTANAVHDTLYDSFDSSYSEAASPYRRSFRAGECLMQSGMIDMPSDTNRLSIIFLEAFTASSSYNLTLTPHGVSPSADATDSLSIIGYYADSVQVIKKWIDGRYISWVAIGY